MGFVWQRMIQVASGALLRRQNLSAEARLGRQGEEAAYWHLRRQGFIMVARNYHPAELRGEIDLIGWEGETLVFVEVRTRSATPLRLPEATVDAEKQQHVIAAAREYRRRANRLAARFRFDLVSVLATPAGMEIQHFRNAFSERAFTSPP